MKSAPDITSASLLASNTRLPARTAASVGRRPAAPTMAAITTSQSGWAAASSSASGPKRMSMPAASAPSLSRSAAAAAAEPSTAMAGRKSRHSAASLSTCALAVNAKTR
jgi:hypothetical protein